jgi:hypothetical protein
MQQSDPFWANSIAQRWVDRTPPADPLDSVPHGLECDTSCNRCLRDFHNLPYHGLLDWRLALDMARIAAGGANVDLSSPWGTAPNPWDNLIGAGMPVPATMERLGYPTFQSFAGLPGFVHRSNNRIRLVCHPLWAENHPSLVTARQAAQASFRGAVVLRVNPFRLLRRPADYVGDTHG